MHYEGRKKNSQEFQAFERLKKDEPLKKSAKIGVNRTTKIWGLGSAVKIPHLDCFTQVFSSLSSLKILELKKKRYWNSRKAADGCPIRGSTLPRADADLYSSAHECAFIYFELKMFKGSYVQLFSDVPPSSTVSTNWFICVYLPQLYCR